jgi:AAA domain, putative AbiEii toxin, Type IV TA system/AAA ATPase domain
MWLEELQLTDFRGFRQLKLDLRRRLTVVIGVNGAGKSSLVRAIEIGSSYPKGVQDAQPLEPSEHDVREGQQACEIELVFEGGAIHVSRKRSDEVERSRGWALLPQCIVLRSDRAVLNSHDVYLRRAYPPPFEYELPTSFELGEEWFRSREDLENQERVRSRRLEHVDPGLDLVRRAMSAVLPGYSDLHIDRNRPVRPGASQLVLTKSGQELTVDMLSEGERNLLVLSMTIARRLSLLDPTIATSEHAATVVIDEVELHLHPKWQRTVIPSLLRAFPGCQFIVTTHSPQVIGSVPRESIVVLDDFAVYAAAAPTEGRDSNAILEEIMDVPERSEAAGAELDEIARLLDHDELEPARVAIYQLASRWGEDDREVVRLRTALQFRELYDADDSQGQ